MLSNLFLIRAHCWYTKVHPVLLHGNSSFEHIPWGSGDRGDTDGDFIGWYTGETGLWGGGCGMGIGGFLAILDGRISIPVSR